MSSSRIHRNRPHFFTDLSKSNGSEQNKSRSNTKMILTVIKEISRFRFRKSELHPGSNKPFREAYKKALKISISFLAQKIKGFRQALNKTIASHTKIKGPVFEALKQVIKGPQESYEKFLNSKFDQDTLAKLKKLMSLSKSHQRLSDQIKTAYHLLTRKKSNRTIENTCKNMKTAKIQRELKSFVTAAREMIDSRNNQVNLLTESSFDTATDSYDNSGPSMPFGLGDVEFFQQTNLGAYQLSKSKTYLGPINQQNQADGVGIMLNRGGNIAIITRFKDGIQDPNSKSYKFRLFVNRGSAPGQFSAKSLNQKISPGQAISQNHIKAAFNNLRDYLKQKGLFWLSQKSLDT